MIFDFTIFDDDGVPLLGTVDGSGNVTEASFSTDPAHPRPYLKPPEEYAAATVDLVEGAGEIGQGVIEVVDVRTDPADQGTGIVTSILSSVNGEAAIPGRRGLLRQQLPGGGFATLLDGPVRGAKLDSRIVTYRFVTRDEREIERKMRLFETTTLSVVPFGLLEPYGYVRTNQYLVGAVTEQHALPGEYERANLFTRGYPNVGRVRLDMGDSRVQRFVEETLARDGGFERVSTLLRSESSFDPDTNEFLGNFYPVRVRWRPLGGGAWTELVGMEKIPERDSMLEYRPTIEFLGGEAGPAVNLWLYDSSGAALPAHGQDVQVWVTLDDVPVSETAPKWVDAPLGELLRDIYDGAHSNGGTSVRYDPAAMQSFVDSLPRGRFKLEEPIEDAREWLRENVWKPFGAAPAIGEDGRVVPVRYELPPEGVSLLRLDSTNVSPFSARDWAHEDDDAIGSVVFRYIREYVPGESSPGALILGSHVTLDPEAVVERAVEHRYTIGGSGEKRLEFKPVTIRSLGTDTGGALGDELGEIGARLAQSRYLQVRDRFKYGAQKTNSIRARRSDAGVEAVRVGDWVEVDLAWLPDYDLGRRGGVRLAQVVRVQKIDPNWKEFDVEDAGPANQPAEAPTAGAASANADRSVSLPITGYPELGVDARVEAAVGAVRPADGSGDWTLVGRTGAVETITSRPYPEGSTVHLRHRGEAVGRRPSAWVNDGNVSIAAVPGVSDVSLTVGGASGDAVVRWTPNATAAGVRLLYELHEEGETPQAFGDSVDVAAADLEATLAGLVDYGEAVTFRVEPWSGWTGAAVSGTAGDAVEVSGTRARAIGGKGGPAVSILKQTQGSTPLRTNLAVHILDALARAGTLSVWTAPDSRASPDPEVDPPDDEIAVAAGTFVVRPADSPALTNVLSNPRETKYVFAQFVTTDGASSAIASAPVRTFIEPIEPETGRIDPEVELLGGETIENRKRARLAALQAKSKKDDEEARSGFAGVPGKRSAGVPVLDSEGLEVLVDPLERKIGTGLKYPGGQGIDAYRPQEPGANVTETRTAADASNLNGRGAALVEGDAAAGRLADDDLDATPEIDRVAKRLKYLSGSLIDDLEPGEAGANVTENRTANDVQVGVGKAVKEAGAEPTAGKDLSVLAGRTADKVSYTAGGSVDSLKPQEAGANVTETRTSNDAANLNGRGAAAVEGDAGAGRLADDDLDDLESAGDVDRSAKRVVTSKRIEDEVGAETLENRKRSRLAGLQAKSRKDLEEARSGFAGVPGAGAIGIPVLDSDGLGVLLDPVSRRLIGENLEVEKVGDPGTGFGLGEKMEAVDKAIRDLNRLQSGVKFREAGGAVFGLLRGLQWGFARDGDSVVFPTPYESAPAFCHVFPVGRCKTYESSEAGDQLIVTSADDVTATGFDVYAKLHAPQGATTTARYAAFGAGGDADELGEVHGPISPANLPAFDDWYEAMLAGRIETNLDPKFSTGGEVSYTIALETDKTGGGSWVEVGTAGFTHEVLATGVSASQWNGRKISGVVSGVNGSGRFRLRVKAFSNTSNAVVVLANTYFRGSTNSSALDHGLHWFTQSGAADATYPMTPGASDAVLWVALNGAE